MPEGLSEDAGQHIVRNRGKGVPASRMARDPGISARCVRRLRARYRKTGGTRPRMGRPRDHITGAQIRPVAGACEGQPVGAARVAKSLGKNHDTSYGRACRILKKNGMVTASAAKSGRRKWVRYERLYANAMRHTDWHVMKDPRFHAYNLITYLDDASRCVTGAALFEHATSENAALLLGPAIRRFGAPAAMLSDNGSCFVGRNGRKKGPMGTRQPTVFEEELLGRGIALTNSGPYHPQTNGRPGPGPAGVCARRRRRALSDGLFRLMYDHIMGNRDSRPAAGGGPDAPRCQNVTLQQTAIGISPTARLRLFGARTRQPGPALVAEKAPSTLLRRAGFPQSVRG